ncbi:MAG: M48 family metallopeptidase [Magnetococcales bacterium]|nr:M48 family metallopeptidase [Magnetococcales bacterium]
MSPAIRLFTAFALALTLSACATPASGPVHYVKLEQCTSAPATVVNIAVPNQKPISLSREVCLRVRSVLDRIEPQSGVRVDEVLLTNQRSVNAGATRGKNGSTLVLIHAGMMQALGTDDDAWAGLLGHEVAHLALRHSENRQSNESAASSAGRVVSEVLGQLIPGVGGLAASIVGGTVTEMVTRGAFTRPQEVDADRKGLQWMVAAGYDPHGMLRLMEILGRQGSVPEFLSTHPGAENRQQMVQEFIDKQKKP